MRKGVRSAAWAAIAVFVAGACSAAAASLSIPEHGALRLTPPAEWKEAAVETPAGAPPTIAFRRDGDVRGALMVSVLWNAVDVPRFVSAEELREICLRARTPLQGGTVEKDLPLQPLEGPQAKGFYFEATDKNYVAPAGKPRPDDYPTLVHGELLVGPAIASFTILTDLKGNVAEVEALAAIRAATFEPGGDAAPSAEIDGAGVSLRLDLSGFARTEGEKHIRDAYYSLGFFVREESGLNLSILVDDKGDMEFADLERAGVAQSRGYLKFRAGGKVESEAVDEPKGFLVGFPSELSRADAAGHFLQQWYFETFHQGKWLELHFSKVSKDGEDLAPTKAEVLRIVRSLRDPRRTSN